MSYAQLFPCHFSKLHYTYYKQILNKEFKTNVKQNIISISRQVANIIYKDGNGKIVYGKNGFKTTDNGLGTFYTITKKINKKTYKYYRYQTKSLINKGTVNESGLLDVRNISEISTKIYHILNNITQSTGLTFVYSEYIDSGTLPVALALEQAGYERYVLHNQNQLLDYSKNSVGGGGKNKPRCYKCGESMQHKNHMGNKSHKFKVGKYALLSGDFTDLKDIMQHIQVFNSNGNINGEELRIVVGTARLGEGIDLHNIRHVHILEPWWNLSRLEQIIGRAVRHKSHVDLPKEKRNVEIYKYASLPPDKSIEKETIDIYIYKEAEKKDINIKNIEYLLKKSAVDCNVFKDNNLRTDKNIIKQITSIGKTININSGDVPFTKECCYKKNCYYSCIWEPHGNMKINYSTNKFNFTDSVSVKIKKYILDMYKVSYIYSLGDIKKYISKIEHIDDIYIYYTLNQFIVEKILLTDKFKRKGYLIYRGDYYIFQPLDIDNTKLPMYYRNLISKHKNKFIRLNNNIIINNKNNFNVKELVNNINTLYNRYTQYILNNIVKKDELSNKIIIDMIIDKYSIEIINKLYTIKNNKLLDIYFKNVKEKGLKIIGNSITTNNTQNANNICLSNIYGLFIRDSKKGGIFKIINKTKKDNLTVNKKVSKRSTVTGRVCSTYDIYYLKQFYDKMNVNILDIKSKIKKNIYCMYIEFLMRYNHRSDKKNIYFIYNN